MFGAQNTQQILVSLEEQKARVRVRTLQLRKMRSDLRRRAANACYRRSGARGLSEGQSESNVPTQQTADQITEYWSGVVGVPGTCDLNDSAVVQWRAEMDNLPDPTWEEPELRVWKVACRKIKSWNAPGRDGISGFWWKKFHQAAAHFWGIIKGLLNGETEVPAWFVRGRTILFPKEGCLGRPEQYRPITCLNVGYKLVTSS